MQAHVHLVQKLLILAAIAKRSLLNCRDAVISIGLVDPLVTNFWLVENTNVHSLAMQIIAYHVPRKASRNVYVEVVRNCENAHFQFGSVIK